MKKLKEPFSRLRDWIDSNESNFLYAIPIIGGVKSYRMREQARLLSHASDNLDEMSYRKHYKRDSIVVPIFSETIKISDLIVAAHGLTKLNLVETTLGGIGYGFGYLIQSNILPRIYNTKMKRLDS